VIKGLFGFTKVCYRGLAKNLHWLQATCAEASRQSNCNEFELVFQPEVTFDLGGIKLMEALLRWRLPDGRRVSPMQFLPTAQEFGLITSIGDWVMQSAIASAAKWHHGSWPDVRIAINVSASQLLNKDCPPGLVTTRRGRASKAYRKDAAALARWL
jgi:EAL domain-containing protein (putative c-di-GMP-specific phosphodiesterase class I)